MTTGIVQLSDDTSNTGKKIDTFSMTVGGNTVYRQVTCIGDPTTGANAAAVDGSGYLSANVGGTVASAAADSGNPVKTGGKYNSSAPSLSNGNRCDTQMDSAGNTKVNLDVAGLAKSKFRDLAATVQALKASAGRLYGLQICNAQGAACYIQVFDVASGSVTLGTTTPDLEFLVPANTQMNIPLPAQGVIFGTAISIASTTAEKGSSGSSSGVQVFAQYA